MPPKKAKKISLNEFLGGETGSWADEMDSLPNAPAIRTDEERANDRYGRRDDFLSTRPDRSSGASQRDDLPLPTQPPYTAFIGNLAFDLAESELEEFFGSPKTKSIKIIKDREDKPKGFGYIEFVELDGLKDALAKSGTNLSGRTIRVSVAEPPKDRPGFGGADDEAKFDNPWRRDGPPAAISREPSRRRFESSTDRPLSSLSEGPTDWRASGRPAVTRAEPEAPSFRRKASGFAEGSAGAADTEENWTIGSKFKAASTTEDTVSKFGRPRGDMGPPREPVSTIPDEIDWRASARSRPAAKDSTSPTGSTPPTPQLNRRKLELLPRSGNASVTPSPLSSPKLAHSPAPVVSATRASPFGAAKPVDVTSKEKEVAERIEKDRALPMSRTTSLRGSERTPSLRGSERTPSLRGSERTPANRVQTPPPPTPTSATTKLPASTTAPTKPAVASNVRQTLSFAGAAAKKDTGAEIKTQDATNDAVAKATENLAETNI